MDYKLIKAFNMVLEIMDIEYPKYNWKNMDMMEIMNIKLVSDCPEGICDVYEIRVDIKYSIKNKKGAIWKGNYWIELKKDYAKILIDYFERKNKE